MKIQIYTIYDAQAKRAIQPIARDNDDVAKRDFVTMVANPQTPFGQNPRDYTLYHCGEWDDENMLFTEGLPATRLMNGWEALTIANQQAQPQMLGDVLKAANGIKQQAE